MQRSSLQGTRLVAHRPQQMRQSRAQVHVVRAAKVADGPKVAIVGVTGAVGQEFLRVRRQLHLSSHLSLSGSTASKSIPVLIAGPEGEKFPLQ